MKYGFVGSWGTPSEMLQLAEAAEATGWDGFFTWDGISVGPMDTFDPWSLLGALSVRTSTIRLGAIVFALARRRPWKVVRESITIDHLSNGRLVLPVAFGAESDGGFMNIEGEPATRKERAARLDETLAFMEEAWKGETFDFSGTYYNTRDLVFQPKPVQQPRIPIWVVAVPSSDRSMQRAVRWDGVLPTAPLGTPAEEYLEVVKQTVAWLKENGTPNGEFDVIAEGVTPNDNPEAAASKVRAFAEAGATWWIESRWDESENFASLMKRVQQGPPGV